MILRLLGQKQADLNAGWETLNRHKGQFEKAVRAFYQNKAKLDQDLEEYEMKIKEREGELERWAREEYEDPFL